MVEGSISHGTMRNADLIPKFCGLLENLSKDTLHPSHVDMCEAIRESIKTDPDYFETELADYDLHDLFEALDLYSEPGYYFGSHPGDGSDFGFWKE
jgi:hypothetical protein